jgi:hypothetical protein
MYWKKHSDVSEEAAASIVRVQVTFTALISYLECRAADSFETLEASSCTVHFYP